MNITGERLRQLRENKQLSQGEVAKLIGVSRPAYVLYETGRSKPLRKIKELCALFNVTSDYILGNDNNTSNTQTENKPKDLIKLLEKEEYTLNGVLVNQEDKEKLKRIIEAAFWDAKEKNKRKK
ncbi:helix-turn-helix transcriptional regulator [Megamonas funiformis]|jgi:transcriptional regulator with XRE-family HTH domain|uniref:helix-turn-helix domain-containing protein n=1 Tax=Megamonas funiformis TaxID=437897 RepID=UPI0029421763|nr:helix-turn-helix transcriptional regulator [Megamonas funiformis]